MATFLSPKNSASFGTNGSIYSNYGQLGRSTFVDTLASNLNQSDTNFQGENKHRYYIGPSGAPRNFRLSAISGPIGRGYQCWLKNTSIDQRLNVEEQSGTTLEELNLGILNAFVARTAGSPDVWDNVSILTALPENFVYVDAVEGFASSVAQVNRLDLPFSNINDANTAAAALTNPVFYVRPGTYALTGTLSKTGATWFFAPGAIVSSATGSTLFASDADIYGYAEILGVGGFRALYSGGGGTGNYLQAERLENINVLYDGNVDDVFVNIYETIECTFGFTSSFINVATVKIFNSIGTTTTRGGFSIGSGTVNVDIYYAETVGTNLFSFIGAAIDSTVHVEIFNPVNSSSLNLSHSSPSVVSAYFGQIIGTSTTSTSMSTSSSGLTSIYVGYFRSEFRHCTFNGSGDIFLHIGKLYQTGATATQDAITVGGSNKCAILFNEALSDAPTSGGNNIFEVSSSDTVSIEGNYLETTIKPGISAFSSANLSVKINSAIINGNATLCSCSGGSLKYTGNSIVSIGSTSIFNFFASPARIFVDVNYIEGQTSSVNIPLVSLNHSNDACQMFFRFGTMVHSGVATGACFDIRRGINVINGDLLRGDISFLRGALYIRQGELRANIRQMETGGGPSLRTFSAISGIPPIIQLFVDEARQTSGTTSNIIINTSTIGVGSLMFGGRFVTFGATTAPITISQASPPNLRLIRASLLSSSGTPTQSIDFTALGNLTIEYQGHCAVQSAPAATGGGSLTQLGTLDIAAFN